MRAGMSLQKRSLVCQLEGGVGSESGSTVDGTNPATVEVGSLSHYLEGFAHPRWRRISSINSTTQNLDLQTVVHWKYLLAFTDSEQNRTGPECNFAELGKWKQHGVFYLSVKVCIFYLPTIKLHIYTNTPLSMYGLKQLEFWCTLKQMDVRCVCLKSHPRRAPETSLLSALLPRASGTLGTSHGALLLALSSNRQSCLVTTLTSEFRGFVSCHCHSGRGERKKIYPGILRWIWSEGETGQGFTNLLTQFV